MIAALAKGTVQGLTAPLSELFLKLLGPGAEEAGLAIKDEIQLRRAKRRRRLLERSHEMFQVIHKEPEPIPLKLLLPIMENGSLEENDELQDRWAALLVNSSGTNMVLPGATDILKQLSPYEVLLLQMCYEFVCIDVYPSNPRLYRKPLKDTIKKWCGVLDGQPNSWRPGMEHHVDRAVMTENLVRLGLFRLGKDAKGQTSPFMTAVGYEFTRLCQTHL
jgi:hypothetical protein